MTSARENMHQNRIQSKNARSFRQLLVRIRMARLSSLAGRRIGYGCFFAPENVHAQEYPWCVSRERYLYRFYKTQEQCQWTASGIGGCALTPRLLFPNKPSDPNARATSQSKDPLSRMN
jgi:Protein of unknown function (DUF3551)